MANRAEHLAEALRDRHPDAEPSEVDPGTLEGWAREVGADPDDTALIASAVAHWELLIV